MVLSVTKGSGRALDMSSSFSTRLHVSTSSSEWSFNMQIVKWSRATGMNSDGSTSWRASAWNAFVASLTSPTASGSERKCVYLVPRPRGIRGLQKGLKSCPALPIECCNCCFSQECVSGCAMGFPLSMLPAGVRGWGIRQALLLLLEEQLDLRLGRHDRRLVPRLERHNVRAVFLLRHLATGRHRSDAAKAAVTMQLQIPHNTTVFWHKNCLTSPAFLSKGRGLRGSAPGLRIDSRARGAPSPAQRVR